MVSTQAQSVSFFGCFRDRFRNRLTIIPFLAVWHSELSKAASRGKGVRRLSNEIKGNALTIYIAGY